MKTVLIFVPNYFPGYMSGGIARTIVNTVEWLGDEISFLIVTRDRDLGDKAPYPNIKRGVWVQMNQSQVRYLAPGELTLSSLMTLIRDTPHDILHLNSFFDPVFTIKLLLLIRLKRIQPRQVILSPRGEFVEGNLKHAKLKYPKKRLYIELSKLVGFYRNLRWHASSLHEAEGIAKAMLISLDRVRSAIDLPIKNGAAVLDHQPSGDHLRVVFLARLSREKNLDGALRILQSVRQPMNFDIFGPEEDPVYWQECTALLKKLPSHVCARYLGPLAPEQVFHHLSQYDVLLLPSHGENYGHAIAESISVGTRVLISRTTPWRNLEQDGVGWDIDLTQVDEFSAVLDQLANQTPSERTTARQRVRTAAAKRLFDPVALENNRLLYSNL